MVCLADIANCSNGFTFREKPRDSRAGNVRVIQIGDIGTDGAFDPRYSAKVVMPEPERKFQLQKGDIVFRGRGAGFAAAPVPDHDKPIMAASPLIWIRPVHDRVDSAYLAWVINSPAAQRFFLKAAQGTIVKAVGVRELTQLEIPLPSLEQQRKIVAAANLLQREQQILNELAVKRGQLTTALLMKNTNNGRKRA